MAERVSKHKCVNDFIAAFETLLSEERDDVLLDTEGFIQGYRDGKEEAWREMLDLDCESVLDEASGSALAETMTDANVRPNTKLGKGWSS